MFIFREFLQIVDISQRAMKFLECFTFTSVLLFYAINIP